MTFVDGGVLAQSNQSTRRSKVTRKPLHDDTASKVIWTADCSWGSEMEVSGSNQEGRGAPGQWVHWLEESIFGWHDFPEDA